MLWKNFLKKYAYENVLLVDKATTGGRFCRRKGVADNRI